MQKIPNDETMRAVAARAIKAFDLIDSGRIDQGKRVLESLIRVLPKPTERNTKAAQHGG